MKVKELEERIRKYDGETEIRILFEDGDRCEFLAMDINNVRIDEDDEYISLYCSLDDVKETFDFDGV